MKSKIRAAMYGLAIGNAMGIPALYRLSSEMYEPIENIQGGGFLKQPPGTLGDAAEMTLCIAESVGEKQDLDYADMLKKLENWEKSPASLFSAEDVVPRALAHFRAGMPALECGVESDFGSAAFRMLPVAIDLYLKYGENLLLYTGAMKEIERASAITHTNMESFVLSALFCGFVGSLLGGKKLEETVDVNLLLLKHYFFQKGYCVDMLWNHVVTKDDIYVQPCQLASAPPASAVFDWSTFLMFRGENYRQNVLRAVNANMPAPDMLAAVVGCLSGLMYGYHDIPAEWISCVKSDRIDICCKRLEDYWDYVVRELGIGYKSQNDTFWWR